MADTCGNLQAVTTAVRASSGVAPWALMTRHLSSNLQCDVPFVSLGALRRTPLGGARFEGAEADLPRL